MNKYLNNVLYAQFAPRRIKRCLNTYSHENMCLSPSNAFDPLLHDERDATDAIHNNADQPSVLPENHSSDCLTPDSASSYIKKSKSKNMKVALEI